MVFLIILNIAGFSNYFKCRFAWRGGGVMLYVDAKLISKLLFVLSNDLPFGLLSVKLFTHKPIVITLVYRPPDCSAADTLAMQNLLDEILAKATSAVFIMLGDFNLLNICWYNLASSCNDGMHNNFHEFVLHNDLYQLIKEPTRNNSILYMLLTSLADLFRPISIQPSIGISGYDVVSFQFLSSILGKFYAVIENIIKTFVPLKKKCTTISQKCLPRHILRLIHKKTYAWCRSKLIPSADNI